MDFVSLRLIRLRELEMILSHFPPRGRVLELGAGAGYQAKDLAQRGYVVTALDVAGSVYESERVFRVEEYDGRHIPYSDGYFDVVFSSNLLEHIHDPRLLLAETRRVLRRDGRAIHVVPTSTWRLWSLIAYYPYVIRAAILLLRDKNIAVKADADRPKRSWTAYLRALWPPRHGETGTAIIELVTYSRWRWRRLMRKSGFAIRSEQPLRLFYTGAHLLGTRLSISTRESLSRAFGSACRVFVLQPRTLPPDLGNR